MYPDESTYTNAEAAANPFSNFNLSGILNNNTLNKAVDTALDVYAIRETGKVLGSVYPTGQMNPASVPARTGAANPYAFDFKPYIVPTLGIVAGALLIAYALKK